MEVPGHIICDVCGRDKGETNHWIIAATIPPTPEAPGEIGIGFAPMGTPVNDPDAKIEHLCGQGCATKRFSQWLETL